MWLVSVSVVLAVVQCASSAGGSPRLPTRSTPPLRGASAAPTATSRTATATTNAFRTGTEHAMRLPPQGVSGQVRRLCPGVGALVNARMGGEGASRRAAGGAAWPLRRAQGGKGYGTVMVVPSPVAVMVNVPLAFVVYPYTPHAGVPPGGGAGTEAMNGPAGWFRPLNT